MSAPRFDRRLITPMILGTVLNPINSSIIAVSLVPIGRAFGAPTSQTAWLVSALYLATAIGQPVVGRLVDLYGPKRLLLAGAILTAIAGVLGTVAPNLAVLVVARIILGFGTCAGYPASMFLIRTEAKRTGLASPSGVLTALSVSSQTISVIGPSLGGLLIGLGGWRTTFAINIPLGIASFVVAAIFLPSRFGIQDDPSPDAANPSPSKSVCLDFPGIGLFAATMMSLLLFLMNPSLEHTYLLAITAASIAALSWWELRAAEPFLDLRLLAGNFPLLATYARALLAATVSYAFLYGFTQWMEDSRDLSAAEAGLLLIPMSLVAVTVSTTTGKLPEIRAKLIAGAALQIAGCALLLTLRGSSAIYLLIIITMVSGLPQGLINLANQNAVYHQADAARLGSSAGLLRTFTYLGAMIASAINSALFGQTASTSGLHHIGMLLLVVAALFLLLTLTDRSLARIGQPNASAPGPDTDAEHPPTVISSR